MAPSPPRPLAGALLALLLRASPPVRFAAAQAAYGDDSVKYKFFCGSSFGDIQADTCADRQWCPSSSDDECDVPGHVCFAGTPCDARLVGEVKVPTYSLSLHPEYRAPGDKMFCGTDYSEALATCEAGGPAALARHCPDGECAVPGQACYIDMPCSHFVMTDPLSNPLLGVNEMEVAEDVLPDPGSPPSHFFCGATFQEAARDCASATWCRGGTSQECPNGEICFVGVNAQNAACEINAIKKAEYQAMKAASRAPTSAAAATRPTVRPTHSPLRSDDPKNRKFCGTDWNDASEGCLLERFCPNGDGDCPPGLRCFDYTRCDAVGLTFMPTQAP